MYCNIREMLRENYKSIRSMFDREFRKEERKYNLEFLPNLEQINTNNPRYVWVQMKRPGPSKVTRISMKVYGVNGNITADIEKVLNVFWGFIKQSRFENNFYEKYINDKVYVESDMENDYFI